MEKLTGNTTWGEIIVTAVQELRQHGANEETCCRVLLRAAAFFAAGNVRRSEWIEYCLAELDEGAVIKAAGMIGLTREDLIKIAEKDGTNAVQAKFDEALKAARAEKN